MEWLGAWLLTYLLHSTLLLGGAAFLRLAFGERHLGLQEAVLRAALVGGLLTASLQVGLGLQPLGGVVTLRDRPTAAPYGGARLTAPRAASDITALTGSGENDVLFGPLPAVLDEFDARRQAPAGDRALDLPIPVHWRAALGGLWVLMALVALARLGGASVRLRRLLRPRRPVGGRLGARSADLASALGLRRPVPLNAAPRLAVPLATGVWRPEVCLPTRALEELEDDQQDAICAHELAHVARRDPAWILLARGIEAAAPLQPLNGWARRRLQDLAECLSDDLAVAASARPEGLARSLVDVAAWTVADTRPLPAAAAGAVSTRSRLGHRVERLMDPMRVPERPGRLLLPLASAAVLATALVTPVVSGDPVAEPGFGFLEAAAGQELAEARPPAPPVPAAPATPAEPAVPTEPAVPVEPATPALPEPPEAPEPPAVPEGPEPVDPSDTEAGRRLEELVERITQRAEAHDDELAEIEARIEAVVEAQLPDEKELAALTERLHSAASAYAEASVAAHQEGASEETQRGLEAVRAELAEAREAVQEVARSAQIPEAELQELREKARELARRARPTAGEREEIRRLSEELAREIRPQVDELRGELEELRRELERDTLSELREQMRDLRVEIREQVRVAVPEIRELVRSAREIAVEVAREVERERRTEREGSLHRVREREVTRDSSEGTGALEEAEESHRQSLDEGPGADTP